MIFTLSSGNKRLRRKAVSRCHLPFGNPRNERKNKLQEEKLKRRQSREKTIVANFHQQSSAQNSFRLNELSLGWIWPCPIANILYLLMFLIQIPAHVITQILISAMKVATLDLKFLSSAYMSDPNISAIINNSMRFRGFSSQINSSIL